MNILSWVYITAHNFSCLYDVWSAVFAHLHYKAYYSLLSLRNSRVLRGCMQLPWRGSYESDWCEIGELNYRYTGAMFYKHSLTPTVIFTYRKSRWICNCWQMCWVWSWRLCLLTANTHVTHVWRRCACKQRWYSVIQTFVRAALEAQILFILKLILASRMKSSATSQV